MSTTLSVSNSGTKKQDVYSGIAINKNRVKHYKVNNIDSVYMDDKTEFELELHNRTSKSKLCKILMNGKLISDSHLVLRPGERVFLDCNPVTRKKFIFNTYLIDKSDSHLVSDNGSISIEWYDERVITEYWKYTPTPFIPYTPVIPYVPYVPYVPSPYFGDQPYTSPHTGEPNIFYSTSNISYSNDDSNISYTNNVSNNVSHRTGTLNNNQVETGIINQEKESNQKFSNVYIDFNNWYSFKTELKILPKSQYSTIELRKYCTSCGKKVKQHWKACPLCGTKV